MDLRADLIAAKHLIDTPAKCTALDIYGAVRGVAKGERNERFNAMEDALRRQLPRPRDLLALYYVPQKNHRQVMALFDRAIKAADSAQVEHAE